MLVICTGYCLKLYKDISNRILMDVCLVMTEIPDCRVPQ